eukprot:TRINITY_DN12428_c0_g1_i1.p1 TRINITY_DN12428_c0_g1~~TRINITY_DN12428_c0_g1_i1.p1  ORF type:complete len:351 (+),score=119.73 TRINITY_DN12428_c0_g1_i1:68-1120(+)
MSGVGQPGGGSLARQGSRRLNGRYEISTNPLGEGAFGKVYEAIDWSRQQPVAVKKLGGRVFENHVEARRVLREIRFMAHFRAHPYIVDLFDIVELPGHAPPILVMELMQCNLDELLTKNPHINEGHAIIFTKQILIALDVLHAAHVMHRDLTTRNVLIRLTEAREYHVKICDMGLARDQPDEEQDDDPMQFTRALTCAVTTRWWQAPEMLLHGRYDKSVDIWAAGCILGQMLRPYKSPQESLMSEEGCRRGLFKGYCEEETLGMIVALLGPPAPEVLTRIGGSDFPDLPEEGLGPVDFGAYFQQPEGGPVCPAGLDLLRRMLQFDPERRITAHRGSSTPTSWTRRTIRTW